MNNTEKNRQYESALTSLLASSPRAKVLALGEPSLLGLIAAKLDTSKVTIVQENNQFRDVIRTLSIKNGLEGMGL